VRTARTFERAVLMHDRIDEGLSGLNTRVIAEPSRSLRPRRSARKIRARHRKSAIALSPSVLDADQLDGSASEAGGHRRSPVRRKSACRSTSARGPVQIAQRCGTASCALLNSAPHPGVLGSPPALELTTSEPSRSATRDRPPA
jgi:hypothetical protein